MITPTSYGLYRLVWREQVYFFGTMTEAAIHMAQLEGTATLALRRTVSARCGYSTSPASCSESAEENYLLSDQGTDEYASTGNISSLRTSCDANLIGLDQKDKMRGELCS